MHHFALFLKPLWKILHDLTPRSVASLPLMSFIFGFTRPLPFYPWPQTTLSISLAIGLSGNQPTLRFGWAMGSLPIGSLLLFSPSIQVLLPIASISAG